MELQDAKRFVARYFHDGITESFARHIRALEKFLREEWKASLERINVLGLDTIPLGQARMMFHRVEHLRLAPPDQPAFVEKINIFIFFGLDSTRPSGRPPDTSLREAERTLHIDARIALAHELAHLALGHFFNTKGELRIRRISDKEETLAYAYAFCLAKVASDYLERDHPMIVKFDELRKALYRLCPTFSTYPGGNEFVEAARSTDCAERLPDVLFDLYRK